MRAAKLVLATLGAAMATSVCAATNDRSPPDRAPSTMTSREIAEFNKGLDGNHPYFIKCRKLDEIGSLVKKARVCRTNDGWARSATIGNDNVRDTLQGLTKAPVNSN